MKLPALLLAAGLLAAPSFAATELPPTVIECAGLFETVSSDTETTSTFHDQVVVTGNGIRVTCDFLQVIAVRKTDPTALIGKGGNFKSLIATGHVRIEQGDRVATCGHAEIFPGEDKIVLTEEPTVSIARDDYVATGPRMELYRGQRRAVILGEPTKRVHVTLPELKDLGAGADKKSAPAAGEPAPKQP